MLIIDSNSNKVKNESEEIGTILKAKAMHARLWPTKHEFTYSFYTYCLDLELLNTTSRTVRGFSYNSFNLASIYDRDYLQPDTTPILQKLKDFLYSRAYTKPIARCLLVTAPRYFGYVFNPANFYFCYDADGKLIYFVTEINNTYVEKHIYVVEVTEGLLQNGVYSGLKPKNFHVSPFFSMDYNYQFYFSDIRDKLEIRINLVKEGKTFFVSRFWGNSQKLNSASLARMFLAYPLRPALTMPRIMWQALRLIFQRKLKVLNKPNPSSVDTVRVEAYSWVDQICIGFLRKQAAKIKRGKLVLVYPDNREEYYGDLSCSSPVRLKLNNFNIFRKIVFGGSIGLGESYVDGDWDADNLACVLKLFLNNTDALDEKKLNAWKPSRLLNWFSHKLRGNSLSHSKNNISSHYDLSNDLFKLFLDPSMMYSSAKFEHAQESLEQAQHNKIRAILDKSGIGEGEELLEIGSGWGSLAIDAAKNYGCKVTSLTLSKEQKAYAEEKAAEAGVADKVRFLLCDYRHAQGKFDAIVSVEMLEAVGHEHLSSFFSTCERLLKPDGKLVLQFIAFPDSYYSSYQKRQDWIQKYIFPGSHLPSLSALMQAVSSSSTLMMENLENIAQSYARTLQIWRDRFNQQQEEVQNLGFDQRFVRMWNFYLASCEAEFATRWLGLYQVSFSRPNNQKLVSLGL
jgi:cyclopropane-fatty-acyl-phospholipid synthase